MINYTCPHYINCQRKHVALTRPEGHWPPDAAGWKAGTTAALDQLTDMARVYLADVRRPAKAPGRIWSEDEARALLIHLCEAMLGSALYHDTSWCRTMLNEVNP